MIVRRYISLVLVTGKVMHEEQVPLEVGAFIIDGDGRALGAYSSPLIPSERYDLTMVDMYSPASMISQLRAEGLWSEMQINAIQADVADRTIKKLIDDYCASGTKVAILCDVKASTREAFQRFLPLTTRTLERLDGVWLEVEPLKQFVEFERIYDQTVWPVRAAKRCEQIMRYGMHMAQTLKAGASTLTGSR